MSEQTGSSGRHQAWISAAREQFAAAKGVGGSSGDRAAAGAPGGTASASGGRRISAAPELPGYSGLVELHRGGQGVVYRGVQKSTGRTVAIKVMREGPFAGESDRLRFEREAAILAKLQHDRVVGILDRGEEAGCYYFVMDYVDGRSLDRYVREEQTSLRKRLELFALICETVSAAHVKGIIHRDLKPGNLLVDETGQPRVLDFGLAKLTSLDDVTTAPAQTMTGQFIGSLPWASPEQVGGEPDQIDTRTDVYSLGVILFHLLTETFPYRVVGRPKDVMENILSVVPEAPSRVAKSTFQVTAPGERIDADLDTIALKCLQKDRARRYQTAAELARDVRHYLGGEPIEARRDSTWYLLTKLAARHRTPAVVAGAFVLLIVASGVVSLALWRQATQERDRAIKVGDMEASARHRADAEAAKAQAVSGFLEEMLTAADPTVARNPDLTVKEALDVSAKKIDEGSLKSQPEVEIAARNAIGKTYFGLGLYEESLAQHRRALEMARPGGEGTATIVDEDMLAELLRRLGETLSTMGKIEEAEKVFGEALEIGRRRHGDRSTEVGFCLNELAIIRKTVGDREGAEKLYRETLEITRVTPGPDSPEYCVTLNNLAILVSGRGDFDEAEKMMREVLETRRRVLGEDSPEVANSLNSIANVLQSKGDSKSAEAMLRDALSLRRRVFGAEHPAVATNINDLGVMLDGLGRHDEAAELLTQSLEMRRKLLGPEHTETAVSLNNLAYALFNKRDYPGAIKMFSDALELIRKGFGPVHPYVSGVLWNLADVYEAMHDDEAFEKATREMLEVDTKLFGLDSPKVCNDQVRVAACLIRTDRAAEAEGLLRQCVKVREKVLPPGTWTIYSARSLLGEALAAQEKFEEAETLLVSACDDLQKNELAPPIRKKEAIERVIRLYESWGVAAADKLSLAQPWRDQLAKLDEP
ncbi:hypothetical protein B7486_19585 [cyanobacterium TDX16]|nr:hypothetical protein B7486_19585 [cyanobacterium TDX16]